MNLLGNYNKLLSNGALCPHLRVMTAQALHNPLLSCLQELCSEPSPGIPCSIALARWPPRSGIEATFIPDLTCTVLNHSPSGPHLLRYSYSKSCYFGREY